MCFPQSASLHPALTMHRLTKLDSGIPVPWFAVGAPSLSEVRRSCPCLLRECHIAWAQESHGQVPLFSGNSVSTVIEPLGLDYMAYLGLQEASYLQKSI